MSDFNLTNRVVQDNNLIQAINKLDRTTFKVFEMAVSCIDTNNPKQEITLSKHDIFNFLDMGNSNRYTRMEEVMKRLSQQGIILNLPNDEKMLVNVTSTLRWGTKDDNDRVIIRFNDLIMPYLVELKANFTQYQITEIKGLNSKYSLILFKWLMMKHNAYQSNPEISMKELRELTDTVDEYTDRFNNFNNKVLKVAKDEITKHTTLNVSYTKIARKGRKITSIQWHVKEKTKDKAIDVTPIEILAIDGDLNTLYTLFKVDMKKDLSEADKTLIRALNDRYGYDNVVEAIRQAIIKRSTSIRYVEKVLKGDTAIKEAKPTTELFESSEGGLFESELIDFGADVGNEIPDKQMTLNDFIDEGNQNLEKKHKWKFWNKK